MVECTVGGGGAGDLPSRTHARLPVEPATGGCVEQGEERGLGTAELGLFSWEGQPQSGTGFTLACARNGQCTEWPVHGAQWRRPCRAELLTVIMPVQVGETRPSFAAGESRACDRRDLPPSRAGACRSCGLGAGGREGGAPHSPGAGSRCRAPCPFHSDPESAGAGTGKCSHSRTPSRFLVWPRRASGRADLDFGLDRLRREAPVGPSAGTRHSVSQILLLLSRTTLLLEVLTSPC